MQLTSARERREGHISARLSFALWSVPTALSTTETLVFATLGKRPLAPWRAFVAEAPQWYSWAVYTPLIVALGERFPIRRPLRLRNIVVHAVASLLFSGVTATADALVNLLVRPAARSLSSSILGWFFSGLPATTLAYFAIIGVSYALGSASRLRERERTAAVLEAQLRDAQLSALRMQLQPHFLFNSLNAIMALVRSGNATSAVRALELLSDVLRTAINAGDSNETSLRNEIEFAERYLEIERVRFGDRLRVQIDTDPAVMQARVPVFILQPFVENALKHGVLRERTGNAIAISARRASDALVLTVRDDGVGLHADASPAVGVGIRNARERLRHMYGDRASISITGRPGSGTTVEIRLPAPT